MPKSPIYLKKHVEREQIPTSLINNHEHIRPNTSHSSQSLMKSRNHNAKNMIWVCLKIPLNPLVYHHFPYINDHFPYISLPSFSLNNFPLNMVIPIFPSSMNTPKSIGLPVHFPIFSLYQRPFFFMAVPMGCAPSFTSTLSAVPKSSVCTAMRWTAKGKEMLYQGWGVCPGRDPMPLISESG